MGGVPGAKRSLDRQDVRARQRRTIGRRRCQNLHRLLTRIARHLTHDTGPMPYRPGGRSWRGSSNPLRDPKRASYAVRLAAARATRRKPRHGVAGAVIAVVLVLIVMVVTVASATLIAAGGAVGVTIATLEQGLPDVRAFRDLGWAQPTTMYDRSGKEVLARFWEERREVVTFREIPQLVLDVTTAVEDDTFWDNPGYDLEATINA